jgi:hypothetical protein
VIFEKKLESEEIMKNFFDKLTSIEHKITVEKGYFTLFTIPYRNTSIKKYDLIVSAPWITVNKREALKYFVNNIKSIFRPKELIYISRIVIIDQNNRDIEAMINIIRDILS